MEEIKELLEKMVSLKKALFKHVLMKEFARLNFCLVPQPFRQACHQVAFAVRLQPLKWF